MNYSKNVSEETIIEYHKRFVNGEQYLEINANGEIIEIDKEYYWQERAVYNHLYLIVNRYKNLSEKAIYGKNGLVSLLLPLQRAYNAIKNRELEYINRANNDVIFVEDGSIDVDDLIEEGLQPGKVLLYRNGSIKPEILTHNLDTSSYLASETAILKEMHDIAQQYAQRCVESIDKN